MALCGGLPPKLQLQRHGRQHVARNTFECHQALGTARTDVHSRDLQAHRPGSQHSEEYQRSDETEPTYARRVSPSKLDPYAEKLANWLGIEATESQKQRRNLKQIHTFMELNFFAQASSTLGMAEPGTN
jgi:hypothetical protein